MKEQQLYSHKNKFYEDKTKTITCNGVYRCYGVIYHFLDGLFHCEDGPAKDVMGGHKEFWLNGKIHRLNGPAIYVVGGKQSWWFEGTRVYTSKDGFVIGKDKIEELPDDFKYSIIKYELSK
jgi:hypothetical protein